MTELQLYIATNTAIKWVAVAYTLCSTVYTNQSTLVIATLGLCMCVLVNIFTRAYLKGYLNGTPC